MRVKLEVSHLCNLNWLHILFLLGSVNEVPNISILCLGSGVEAGEPSNGAKVYLGKDVNVDSQRRDLVHSSEEVNVHDNSSRQIIDFMGASNNLKTSSNSCNSKFDTFSHLDLSLRRSHPSSEENHVGENKFTLHHSDASAFTRLVSVCFNRFSLCLK